MVKFVAVYGSPRRRGNTATLLRQAVGGAREAGAQVEEFFLRDLKISPCLEIYGCKRTGGCVIKDDFQGLLEQIQASDGLMLASPVFFYAVSAHVKALMDRCQSLWVKKYWIDKLPKGQSNFRRRGLFIAAGATSGKRLFDGMLLSVRYFFDVLDAELWRALCYRGLDFEDDARRQTQYLREAYEAGKALTECLLRDQQERSDADP